MIRQDDLVMLPSDLTDQELAQVNAELRAASARDKSTFTARDILIRAEQLLLAGPLERPNEGHSPFCPWCALADAKGQIERENDVPFLLSMAGAFDFQLFCAARALGEQDYLGRDEALMRVREAIEATDE